MSAKGRGTPPTPHDVHNTPAWVVHRLMEGISVSQGNWLEPCAGDGAIIKAVNQRCGDRPPNWYAVEIRDTFAALNAIPGVVETWTARDFLKLTAPPTVVPGWSLPFDFCIMNPPFSLAQEFVDACRPLARVTCALLRLNFLGSEDRAQWWRGMDPRPDVLILPNRPSFSMNGKTDATEYAWFVWHSMTAGRWSILRSTPREERMVKP